MKVVVALGGNAILRRGETGTADEQFRHVKAAVNRISRLVERGDKVIITHGNGPQVGDILIKEECAIPLLPRMPLDICGAESQGMIGYMLQQSLDNVLRARGICRPVITLITRTLVDPDDTAFHHPTKPIGPFYTEEEAVIHRKDHGWDMFRYGTGEKCFRRAVPSPDPLGIVESSSVKSLYDEGFVVIACGGGGIPVYRTQSGELRGTEAVVDKDLAAERLASGIGADILLILTDVDHAYLNFGLPDEKKLEKCTVKEAEHLLKEGHFAEGTMGPKILACIRFVRAGGRTAIITSLEQLEEAMEGKTGTHITANGD